jgi:hypothetical protein
MSNVGQFWEEQFTDDANNPFDGVKVWHYEAGTTSTLDVWLDRDKTTESQQPHVGDSHGMVWFYGDGLYRLRITDKNDILLYDWDNVSISTDNVGIDAGDCEVGMVPVYVGPDNQFECDFVDLATVRGCLPIANCGTGTDDVPTDGSLLIGNTAGGYTVANLTAGTGITITNSNGGIEISTGGQQAQPYGSIGQKSFVASSLSQFTLSADVVMLRDSTGGSTVRYAPSNLTCDVTASGANGGDGSTFAASSWIHFYWIYDAGDIDTSRPESLASLASSVAPPTGPTLPTNYTYWSYAGAVRFNATSQLIRTRIFGNTAFFETRELVKASGDEEVETEVSLSAFIPPNAGYMKVFVQNHKGGTGTHQIEIGYISGSIFNIISSPPGDHGSNYSESFDMPNVSQKLFYKCDSSSNDIEIHMQGYSLPNGGA